MLYAYLSDWSRVARIADRLEEQLVHHGSILQLTNVANTNLVAGHGSQTSTLFAVPSIPSSIIGHSLHANYRSGG